jgi:hypothetical protein
MVPRKRHLYGFDHTPLWAAISIVIAVRPMMWLALMKIKAFGARTQHLFRHRRGQLDLAWPETTGRLTCVLRSARHSRSAD